MKRNSTQLELITPGATTWLPWVSDPGSNRVDGYPIFDGFSGQSRSIRESAWQDFLASEDPLEVIPDPLPPPPEPDWAGFLAPFSIPTAGGIYHSILSKLELSTMGTIDHWTNVKMGLTNAEIRSPQWLVPSWNGLKLMLAADGNPLSEETIAEAEALMAQYHLLP